MKSISSLNEDIIVEQLLRTHDSDGRWIDSKALLQEVEAILSFVLESDVSSPLHPLGLFYLSRCLPITNAT